MNSGPWDPGGDASGPRGDATQGRTVSAILTTLLWAMVPVALVTLLVGYVAYQRSENQPTVYSASARVVLSSSSNFAPVEVSNAYSPDRYVSNQAEIMTTVAVLDLAEAALADGVPTEELQRAISAAPAGANEVVVVTATASDPALAARRADAVANAYAQFTAQQVTTLAQQAAQASVEDPIAVRTINARAAAFGDGVQVIQPAAAPSEPSAPTPARDAYLAATAAFLVSTGLVLALRGVRRRPSPAALAAATGGPLLGTLPVRWFGRLPVPYQPQPADYGVAMQALRYRMPDTGDPSLLVTGVGRDRSSTSALLGLAGADAAQGRTVVVVDATADGHLLRQAGVTSPEVSLTAAVAGGDELDAALRPVPALSGPRGGSVRIGRVERSSGAYGQVLRKSLTALLGTADLVLIDAGSAVRDADAYALLGEVGAVIAVIRSTDRSSAPHELGRRLDLAGRPCDGVLVTRRTWLPSLGPRGQRSGPAPRAWAATP